MESTIALPSQVIIALGTGIAAHLSYFKHGEHHRSGPRIFVSFVVGTFALVFLEAGSWRATGADYRATAFVLVATLVGLFGSMLAYRILYHPLGDYPGPFFAKTTKFWHVWQNRKSQNHLTLDKLYRKYGEFVRTGPSDIAIFVPEALQAIDGPGNQCVKAEWYDILHPVESVILVRDKAQHDRRRRVWDAAYNKTSLAEYEVRIKKHAQCLQEWLIAREGQSVCVNESFYWYAFEIVGDLAFGKPFNLFETGKLNHAVEKMHSFMGMLGQFSSVPWLCVLGIRIPGLRSPWTDFMKWCGGEMSARIKNRADFDESDTSAKLIAHSVKTDHLEQDLPWLYGDAITMVVAGSDSVAQTLVWIMYYLATRPEYQKAVREEIAEVDSSNLEILSAQPVIDSIIREVLRLHPVVPTGGVRKTGDQSIVIKGRVIPPHTTISVSRWTIARRDDVYEKPTEFIPERWTTKPWMVKDQSAYSPFCTGRYSCVGKAIAYRELASALAWIVPSMNVELAPGETGERLGGDLRDCFSASPGPLNLVFRKRA